MAFKLHLNSVKTQLNLSFDLAEISTLNCADFPDWQADIIDFIQQWQRQQPLAVNTSGSTGEAKQIWLEPYVMRDSAVRTINYFAIQSCDKALLCLPAKYIAGKMMVVRAILGQYQLFCIEPNIKLDLTNLQQHKFKFSALIPAQLMALNPEYLACFEQILLGGAKSSEHNFTSIKPAIDRHQVKIFEGYGMTETASHIALRQLWQDKYFKLLPQIQITTQDQCLALRLDERQPWLQTNDLVELLPNNCFKILGRRDNVINSGGLKIIVEALETEVLSQFGCQIYLSAKTDAVFGQKCVICLLEQQQNLRQQLVDWLYPKIKSKQVMLLKQFPLNANNKIDRLALSRFSENL